MAIETKAVFQSARLLFYDARRGWGRAVTNDGRKIYIPSQALIDAGVVTLDRGLIEVMLDEHNPLRAESIRVPAPAPPVAVAAKPRKKK
jgi:hypothetical protein